MYWAKLTNWQTTCFLNCVVERDFLGENLNISPSTSAQHHLPCAGCKAICAGGPLKRLIQQKLTMTMAFWSCLELHNLWLIHWWGHATLEWMLISSKWILYKVPSWEFRHFGHHNSKEKLPSRIGWCRAFTLLHGSPQVKPRDHGPVIDLRHCESKSSTCLSTSQLLSFLYPGWLVNFLASWKLIFRMDYRI